MAFLATSTDVSFGDLLQFLSGIGNYFTNFVSTMPPIFVVLFSVFISLSVIYMIVGRQA